MMTSTRRLFVKHRTEFVYDGAARESVNEVRLGPVDGPRQAVERAALFVTPRADIAESFDVWGNRVWWCQLTEPHGRLVIEAETVVGTRGTPPAALGEPRNTWQVVEGHAYRDRWAEFLVPSGPIKWSPDTHAFAASLGVPRRGGVAQWAADLAIALNAALVYERGATDVTTDVDGVIHHGRGVCQDFAHVFIALCRMAGVAARYVSGWLFEPERTGPVESHAWAEVQVPGAGWIEEDPTHAGEVSDRYVRIAGGRDYGDVVPIKGTYLGGATR